MAKHHYWGFFNIYVLVCHIFVYLEKLDSCVSCFVASCHHKRAEESSDHRSAPLLLTTLSVFICVSSVWTEEDSLWKSQLHVRHAVLTLERMSATEKEVKLNNQMSKKPSDSVPSHLPRGDGGHGGVLVAVPHSVVVGDFPGGDERSAVISQQPLVIWAEDDRKDLLSFSLQTRWQTHNKNTEDQLNSTRRKEKSRLHLLDVLKRHNLKGYSDIF